MIEGSKGGCFPGWALVETPEGQVAIKDIRVGQKIICFDEEGQLHIGVVEKKIEHDEDLVFKLMYWCGEVVLTSNHWVLNQYNAFAEAGTLTTADSVVDKNGHLRPVHSFEKVGLQKVYNLEVSPHHTFICGGIRVHNGGRGVGRYQEFIEGQKGGGKGGGGGSSVYTPKEEPNTLRSKAVARVIDLISEGQCVGLVDGAKSIYFDDVPLQNADDSYNFSGVTYYQRYGTPDQDPIPGFDDVEAEVTVGQEVKFTAPVLFTITNPDVDALRLKVRVNSLFEQLTNGDLVGASVGFTIEVSSNGGPYSLISSPTISGKTVSSYEEAHRFSLPAGGPPYTVRIKRNVAESESASKQDRLYISSYTEITEAKLIYPNSALLGIEVDAQLFGGSIPKRAYEWKGLTIKVPSNYNPTTRVYTGIWDGTFQIAWTDNPAWVLYDILSESRYGLGEYITESQIDKWQLYQIAQYCDELVPDGFGGTEPRFTFNAVINTREEAYAVVNAIVSCFRGMAYWAAGSVTMTQDSPSDVTRLVTPADVIDGEFTYQGSGAKARHSVALVTWNDPADKYLPAIEVVEDQDLVRRKGWNPIDIAAYGCTSRGQAHRVGKWILDSERYETETVTYTASYDHADSKPGDIIAIADPARQGVRMGGRIMGQGGTNFVSEEGLDFVTEDGQLLIPETSLDQLTLDAPYTVQDGDQIMLVMADDTIATLDLVPGTSGTTVTLADALPGDVLNGAMYIIQNTIRITPQLWRIISVVETDKHLFEITALRHDQNKYARVEQGITLEPLPTSLLPTGALVAPSGLVIQESLYKVNNSLKTRVTVSWAPSADPRVTMYRLDVKSPSSNTFYTANIGPLTTAELLDAETGLWSFRVYSLSSSADAGSISSKIEEIDYPIYGKAFPPADVQNLTAVRSYTGVTLSWDKVDDLDLTGYDVKEGTVWASGEIVLENFIGTSTFIELKTSQPTSFMVRARDELGVLSTTIATVTTQVAPLPDLTNFQAYQIGSAVNLSWDGIDGLEKIKYEIREGVSFDAGRLLAITNTPNYSGPFSVNTQTTLNFHVRAFINFDDGSRSISDISSTSIVKYPTLGNNIIFSQLEHPTWGGTLSPELEVTVDDKLTLATGEIEGYYDFEIDLGAEYFGRTWYEAVGSFLDADPLEVDEATMDINDATFFITPFSSLTPQVELYLLDGSNNIIKPFREADYKFTTQKFRVILRMDVGDTLKPALDELSVFFDLPDFML